MVSLISLALEKVQKHDVRLVGHTHNYEKPKTSTIWAGVPFFFILTWRGRGSCSPKRVINKARRLIEYTALHAAVCGRLWL